METLAFDESYVGSFVSGVKHGHGEETFRTGERSGEKYVGDFRTDVRHGHGDWQAPNGDRFIGSFQFGKLHGTGEYHFADGVSKYVGDFLNGKFHGQGTLTDLDVVDGLEYVGSFVKGTWEGIGKITYRDGSCSEGVWGDDILLKGQFTNVNIDVGNSDIRYTGEVENEIPHGNGVLLWPDGRSSTGTFVQGKKHGAFEQTTLDKQILNCTYINGKMHGQIRSIHLDGRVEQTQVNDGVGFGMLVTTWPSGRVESGDMSQRSAFVCGICQFRVFVDTALFECQHCKMDMCGYCVENTIETAAHSKFHDLVQCDWGSVSGDNSEEESDVGQLEVRVESDAFANIDDKHFSAADAM